MTASYGNRDTCAADCLGREEGSIGVSGDVGREWGESEYGR